MTNKQKKKELKKALQYLIDEGFVEQIGDKYRLKTDKELKREIQKMCQQ
jgi:hypothetical protein